MPIYKEWSELQHKIVIWKITEPESFFANELDLFPAINNEKRRLEFFVGRFLLRYLVPEFPLSSIVPDENDKPGVPECKWRFSISHSYPYVAVSVNDEIECGIDLQVWRPNMLRLQHKFLSKNEQDMFQNDEQLLTLAWCAKEAAYKWNGKRGVDFIKQLPISKFDREKNKIEILIANHQEISLIGGLENDFSWMLVTSNKSKK